MFNSIQNLRSISRRVTPVLLLLVIILCSSAAPSGQKARAASALPPPVHLTSQQDHQRMTDLLGIKSLRPGADPNHPNAPNAVNYNESKANPYPNLPNPLILNNDKTVTSAAVWWRARRPQIVRAFNEDVYGKVPRHNSPLESTALRINLIKEAL